MKRWLAKAWYSDSIAVKLLLPFSWLFAVLTAGRHQRLVRKTSAGDVPVVVVGNIAVGGTGKTPVCLALANYFSQQGKRVVFVSRGYGGKSMHYPIVVTGDSDPAQVGDEAVMLAEQTSCAVVVDPRRDRAAGVAATRLGADLIISDDGLQHYALARTIEIAVVDGKRGLGNGCLLPAGPLREPPTRLQTVDYVVCNGSLQRPLPVTVNPTVFHLQPEDLVNLLTGERLQPSEWQRRHVSSRIHAVAGIGNPSRFFTSLRQLGFVIIPHAFDDHHAYAPADLAFAGDDPVVMTTKDAVKCRRFARAHWWALQVTAALPKELLTDIAHRIDDAIKHS